VGVIMGRSPLFTSTGGAHCQLRWYSVPCPQRDAFGFRGDVRRFTDLSKVRRVIGDIANRFCLRLPKEEILTAQPFPIS